MSFINEIASHAERIQKEFGILASLVIAQAIHESNWGKSGLAVKGKNLFGIKGTYNGQSVTMKTWEVYNGKRVQVDAAFRKYPTWYESLKDLANLYENGVSWDRKKYRRVIGETDYTKAAEAVQAAGYATDPKYASKLIAIIESNNLTKYDHASTANKEMGVETKSNKSKLSNKESKVPDTYTVKAGDTLSGIAAMLGLNFKDIQKWNNLKDANLIHPGQKLKLHLFSSGKQYYTIKSGDNLTKIANQHDMTVNQLQALNNIKNPNVIIAGQKIRIK
jgi:LysM repeat protein